MYSILVGGTECLQKAVGAAFWARRFRVATRKRDVYAAKGRFDPMPQRVRGLKYKPLRIRVPKSQVLRAHMGEKGAILM
jgi:hypothetical protein